MCFGRALRFTGGANEARASLHLAFAARLAWAAGRTHAPRLASRLKRAPHCAFNNTAPPRKERIERDETTLVVLCGP